MDDHEQETSTNSGERNPQDDSLGINNISKISLDTGGWEGGINGLHDRNISWETDSAIDANSSVDEELWGGSVSD